MANRLHIEPTRFEDVRTGSVTHGWRAYDDYFADYGNMWVGVPDDDLEFFSLFLEDVDAGTPLYEAVLYAMNQLGGLYIGDQYYKKADLLKVLMQTEFTEML